MTVKRCPTFYYYNVFLYIFIFHFYLRQRLSAYYQNNWKSYERKLSDLQG